MGVFFLCGQSFLSRFKIQDSKNVYSSRKITILYINCNVLTGGPY